MECNQRARPIERFTGRVIMASAKLFRVGLVFRRGIGEGGEGDTGIFNCEQLWIRRQLDAEAARIGELRHEAEIGHSRRLAEAKISLF